MGLRKFMDNIKPTFSKGGKLGFLESTFDAFETFLFVPNTTTSKGAHIRDCNDMKRTMIMVVAALMPAFLFGCYNTGIQVGLEGFTAFFYGLVRVLPMVCVSYIVGSVEMDRVHLPTVLSVDLPQKSLRYGFHLSLRKC